MIVPYRRAGFRGLGTCQVPQAGVPMYYPPCDAVATIQSGLPAQTYVNAPAPAAYVAPGYATTPACASGPSMFTAECIAQVLAAQQANMAAGSAANRAVFEANCNADWAANAERYSALHMAVPPNDCAYRGYGLTLPGTTGGYVGYLPGTPQDILDWRAANPGGGSPGPASGAAPGGGLISAPAVSASSASIRPPVVAPSGSNAPRGTVMDTARNYVGRATEFLEEDVTVAGREFPIWALAAAGVAAVLLMKGGR